MTEFDDLLQPGGLPPVERLRAIMSLLRSDRGCPWDREQSLESLKRYLVEETYEVIDAIDGGDRALLQEELGDLLLQVVFQSQLCEEEGSFDLNDVATGISDKLVRRHPHVFGDVDVADADEVLTNWHAIKQEEKGEEKPRSAVDGIPRHLPALHKAHEVQHRAAKVGFDWDEIPQVLAKVEEEVAEVREALERDDRDHAGEELGDLLFAVVNLSRFLGRHAEEALNEAIGKFVRRFQEMERRVHDRGHRLQDRTLEQLDAVWDEVKEGEAPSSTS